MEEIIELSLAYHEAASAEHAGDRPELAGAGSRRLQQILAVNLADDALAWDLQPDGSWTNVPTKVGVNAHRRLQELAIERARRRREPDPLSPVR